MTDTSAAIAVIGAGPAGLMAAERLAGTGHAVTVYDAMPSPARKFLMAGRGGLNLTHGEPLEAFLTRYGPVDPRLTDTVRAFPPAALRDWADGLDAETFAGSSLRIFPKAMKASPLLRAWLRRLDGLGVRFALRHRWLGWSDDGALLFMAPGGETAVRPVAALLALGGASWPRLGSDGLWTGILERAGVSVASLAPANAGVRIAWSEHLRARFEGTPLKRIALTVDGETRRGEAVITAEGLEGGALYALSASLRAALAHGPAALTIDLRPDLSAADLAARLARPRGSQSLSTFLRKTTGLAPAAIALLREAGALPDNPADIAARIKAVSVPVAGMMPIDRAISSAGGVRFEGLDGFMLKARPGTFVAGEMLDWEAPTGGYLLQACFATAVAAAGEMRGWLSLRGD